MIYIADYYLFRNIIITEGVGGFSVKVNEEIYNVGPLPPHYNDHYEADLQGEKFYLKTKLLNSSCLEAPR